MGVGVGLCYCVVSKKFSCSIIAIIVLSRLICGVLLMISGNESVSVLLSVVGNIAAYLFRARC